MRSLPPDMARRNRAISAPIAYYQEIVNGNRTVGTAAIPLVIGATVNALSLALFTGLANTDVVYVGGVGTSTGNGVPLDPGRGIQFTIMGDMQTFSRSYQAMPEGSEEDFLARVMQANRPHVFISLNKIFLVADAAGQNVRYLYTTLVRI